MTTYFTAPDGHGDDTLWVRYDEPRDLPANPLPIIRKRDLGPMADHWDEIVARVTAGNLSAQQAWALDRAGRNTSIAYPPSRGLMQLMPEWKPSPAAFDVTPKPVDTEPPTATEQWALDRAARMEVLRDAMVYGDSALVVNPPSTPALDKAARLEHIQGQIIANAVTEANFRGRLDRAVGEAWAAGYREAEYEREPSRMSDRDELAALIGRAWGGTDAAQTVGSDIADAILARWRLVPVEQPEPWHQFEDAIDEYRMENVDTTDMIRLLRREFAITIQKTSPDWT